MTRTRRTFMLAGAAALGHEAMTGEDRPDSAAAATAIDAQFPALRPATVAYLGEGYDSTAFEVNGRWVFRFPKRADIERQLLLELRLLPRLAALSPLPVPDFCVHGRPSPAFPRHFGGYPRLPGVPAIGLDPQVLDATAAQSIGRFLSWLHAFPVCAPAAACDARAFRRRILAFPSSLTRCPRFSAARRRADGACPVALASDRALGDPGLRRQLDHPHGAAVSPE